MSLRDFFAELRRRRVFKVTGIYAIVGWLAIQIAATTFPVLMLPEWTVRLVVALFLLGIPVVVVLAWIFDITPEGVERTPRAAAHEAEAATAAATGLRRLPVRISAWGVAVLLVAALGLTFYRYAPFERGRTDGAAALLPEAEALDLSIAVLPFANLSGDADNEYFSDGITEDVLAHLSRIADLKVISRTSVMGYKGTTLRLREIGEELGVAHVLEGSVRREGDRVRIVAQLIDARTDRHLWTETFDRELTGIFQIQSEIAQQIARALQARLSPMEQTRIASTATANLTAYDLFLRAREYLRSGGVEDFETAAALLRQSLDLDPEFAPAWAELTGAYMPLGPVSRARLDSAMVFARKAVELAPDRAEGHWAVALVLRRMGRHSEAAEWYQRAYELDPNDARAIGGLGFANFMLGRWDEALRWFRRAVLLDPTNALRHRQVAFSYEALGDDAEAQRWYGQAARLVPDNPIFQGDLFWLHRRRGDFEAAAARLQALHRMAPDAPRSHAASGNYEILRGNTAAAIRHLERAASLEPDQPAALELAFLYWQRGDREPAQPILRAREQRAREEITAGGEGGYPFLTLARVHAVRGERDAAIRQLEEAVRRRIPLHSTVGDPLLALVRDDPRYQRLIAQVQAELDQQRARLRREGL
jgi:adenylate cyclase